MPASQHQNGAAESLIKFSKGVLKSMKKIYGESKLSINELNTLLAEVTNIVNERPIGVKPNSETDTEYLSPNCLLLGRNSSQISSGPFLEKDLYDEKPAAMKTRFLLVQKMCDQFWNVWTRLYFPTISLATEVAPEAKKSEDWRYLSSSRSQRYPWRMETLYCNRSISRQ